MDAQPTRNRPPLATLLAMIGVLAAPAGLRAELLVNAPPGERPSPGVRPWAPAQALAARPRRDEADDEADAPAAGAARPLLALMLALAIPPTMTASELVSASDTTPKLDKTPTPSGGDSPLPGGGTPPGGTPPGGTPGAQTAPEPASLISGLMGLGVAGAVALARRRRARRQAAAA